MIKDIIIHVVGRTRRKVPFGQNHRRRARTGCAEKGVLPRSLVYTLYDLRPILPQPPVVSLEQAGFSAGQTPRE